jgi:ketosteroid isomerase-like protein
MVKKTNQMDTRKIATAFFERMAANQFAEAFEMMDENVIYTVIGSTPISGVFKGKKDLFERLIPALGKFKDPVNVTVKEYIVEGDRAVVLTAGVGEAPFGHYVQDPCVFVLRVRDGRIIDLLEFVDTVMLETRMFGSTLTRR